MHKRQGIAPIVIVVIVALVAVGGYIALQKTGKAPTLPIPAAVSLNPNCKYNDPDLCKYINRTLSGDFVGKSTSMKGVTKDKSGKMLAESLIETEGESRSHMILKQDGKEFSNTITIDDTVYIKDQKDGKWWKQKQTQEKITEQQMADDEISVKTAEELKKKYQGGDVSYKKIGKEPCGQRNCFKYQQMDNNLTEVTVYILFDDKEYILRKMITMTKDGQTTENDFEFGTAKVSEPSPTKDVPIGQNIYMMGVPGAGMMPEQKPANPQGGTSQEDVNKMMQELQQKYGQ